MSLRSRCTSSTTHISGNLLRKYTSKAVGSIKLLVTVRPMIVDVSMMLMFRLKIESDKVVIYSTHPDTSMIGFSKSFCHSTNPLCTSSNAHKTFRSWFTLSWIAGLIIRFPNGQWLTERVDCARKHRDAWEKFGGTYAGPYVSHQVGIRFRGSEVVGRRTKASPARKSDAKSVYVKKRCLHGVA